MLHVSQSLKKVLGKLEFELRITNYEVKIPRAFARLYGII